MELHYIKEKGNISELTGGCSLNGQIEWWIQKCKKGFASGREFYAWYKFLKTLNCLWNILLLLWLS